VLSIDESVRRGTPITDQRSPSCVRDADETKTENNDAEFAIAGAAGLLLMMGAGAAYASNPNVPNWSPYAVMAYESNGPTYVNPGHGDNYGYPPRFEPGGMGEGRAAFIDPDYNPNFSVGNGYAPNWGDRPSGKGLFT
jgi:hypothetical protein